MPKDTPKQSLSWLFISFGTMFSIAALLTMSALIWGLGTIQENLDEIIETHMDKMGLVVEMRNAARARTLSLANMILLQDPFEQDDEFLKFNSYGAKFANARMALLKKTLDDKESEIIKLQGKASGEAVEMQNDVVDLIYADEIQKARTLLMDTSVPLQNKVMEQLTLLHNYQKKASAKAIKKVEQNYQQTRLIILVFAFAAGFIGLIVAIIIIRRNRQNTLIRENYLNEIELKNTELNLAIEAAEHANASKSMFLANMSHELRTPLNAIIGYSEIIKEDLLDRQIAHESTQDCDKILFSSKHLLDLINEVLDLSKIEAGKMNVLNKIFYIEDLIEPVDLTIKPLSEKNNNKLIINNHAKLESITTDFIKLKQILINLLSNANKFTKDGTITLSIETFSENNKSWFNFTITDTGIGIPEEQMQLIFKPFEQVDSSVTRQYEGTGLGLAITQRLCKLLGGSISISSNLDEGTTCVVLIPNLQQDNTNGGQSPHPLAEVTQHKQKAAS